MTAGGSFVPGPYPKSQSYQCFLHRERRNVAVDIVYGGQPATPFCHRLQTIPYPSAGVLRANNFAPTPPESHRHVRGAFECAAALEASLHGAVMCRQKGIFHSSFGSPFADPNPPPNPNANALVLGLNTIRASRAW